MAGTETRLMTSMQRAFQQAGFEVPNFGSKDLIRMKPRKIEISIIDDPLADILGTEIQEAAPAADWIVIEERPQEPAPAGDWTIVEDSQAVPAVEKPIRVKKTNPKKEDREPKKIKLSKEEAALLRRREARKHRKYQEPRLILELDGFTTTATLDDAANLSVLYQANENWSWLAEPCLAIEVPGSEQFYQKFLMNERRLAGQYKKACNEQVSADGEKQFRRICRCCFLKSFKVREEVKTVRRQAFAAGVPEEQRDLLYGKAPEIVMVPGYFTDGHEFLCSSCKGMKRGDAKSRLCYPHQWTISRLRDVAVSLRIKPERYQNKDELAEAVFSKMKEPTEKSKGKATEDFNLKTWLVKAESQIDRLRRDLVGKPTKNRRLQSDTTADQKVIKETQNTAPAADWEVIESEAPASEFDWVIV